VTVNLRGTGSLMKGPWLSVSRLHHSSHKNLFMPRGSKSIQEIITHKCQFGTVRAESVSHNTETGWTWWQRNRHRVYTGRDAHQRFHIKEYKGIRLSELWFWPPKSVVQACQFNIWCVWLIFEWKCMWWSCEVYIGFTYIYLKDYLERLSNQPITWQLLQCI